MVSLTTLRQLTLTNLLPFLPSTLDDVNIGIAALVLNIAVWGIVSAVLRRPGLGAVTAAGRSAQ